LTAYDLGFHPNGGLAILLLAIVAVIIGGRQSFLGPILGALLVGISRNLVVWFWSSKWQDAVTFLLLAITLLLIPNGILGRKTRLEARTP
jgi:branched-chain amino acid transport system permease protein